MKRTRPKLQLSKSPLVLVLCQVRIAAIRDMATYIPKIQDRLRREGFPVDVSREVQEVTVIAADSATVQRRPHWEFRTLEEDWSIIAAEDQVVVQTTAYSNFEDFVMRLTLAMTAVDSVVGDLVVERVGLRYIDAIQPQPEESWKEYIKPGYHGLENEIIRPDNSILFMQVIADTGPDQHLIARMAQNRTGELLPSDLAKHHPRLAKSVEPGQLVTLLDLDHFRRSRQPFSVENVVNTAWELHDALDLLFRDIVTEYALQRWQ